MTRIISGRFGGIRLDSPKHHLRPTTDRVKEYIFNVCRDFSDASVADLFSGTGGLGLESFSRGATLVHAVDDNYKSYMLIKKNLEKISSPEEFLLFQMKSENFLKKTKLKYDYIIADPPYDYILEDSFFKDVKLKLKNTGKFIFEYHKKWQGSADFPMVLIKEKYFGETGVWIYE